jgi:hypothetical protein
VLNVERETGTFADLCHTGTLQGVGTGSTRYTGPIGLASYAKASLPTAATFTAHMIYVTDDVGGATPAFSDGTNWRRVADRNVIS